MCDISWSCVAGISSFAYFQWIGEDVQHTGEWLVLEELLGPAVDLAAVRQQAEQEKRHVPLGGTRFEFEYTPAEHSTATTTTIITVAATTAATAQEERPQANMFLRDSRTGQQLRVFTTQRFGTHFVIENAVVAPLKHLSFFPEEDEVLFPPLSRYQIKEVEKNFPDNPDKVTLVFMSTG